MTRWAVTRWAWLAALVLGSTASAQTAPSSDRPSRADPFADVEQLDPVELARRVDALGDDAVLDGLAGDASPGAIRATPYMWAPELALSRLVAIASGRDPWSAPLAMVSILEITGGPRLDGRDTREAADLGPVRDALRALESDERARADLRAGAALARGQLSP